MKTYKTGKAFFFLTAFFIIAISADISFGSQNDNGPGDKFEDADGSSSNIKIKPRRLFKKYISSAKITAAQRILPKTMLDNPPAITGETLLKAFNPQNTLRWFYVPGDYNDSLIIMDVGDTNYYSPQHWVMPGVPLEEPDRAKGIPISQAPYLDYFPNATHCKKYTYSEPAESYYEFYEISDSMVILQGTVDSVDNNPFVDIVDFLITPLPLNIDTEFTVDEISHNADSSTTELFEKIEPQGYGTLTTPEGDIQVLKFFNDYLQKDYDSEGTLIDEKHIFFYEFISSEGHMLTVALKNGAPLTGVTEIEYIEYLRIDYSTTGVNEDKQALPQKYVLRQNYPNPFNPSTKISYSIPKESKVKLDVFDLLGKKVAALVDEFKSAGEYTVDFNGKNLASGAYIYSLSVEGNIISIAMMLIK